jgi:transcriptional regulator with PAS, ATPase and Fis domain
MALLEAYRWPGNVRELRNLLERTVILSDPDMVIGRDQLPAELRFGTSPADSGWQLPEEGVDLAEVERGLIAQAMARSAGSVSGAARLLGLTRYQLRYRLKKQD